MKEELYEKLDNMKNNKKVDVETLPADVAINNAKKVVDIFCENETNPDTVEAMNDGGVYINKKKEGRFIIFELYNDGEIIYLKDKDIADEKTEPIVESLKDKEITSEYLI